MIFGTANSGSFGSWNIQMYQDLSNWFSPCGTVANRDSRSRYQRFKCAVSGPEAESIEATAASARSSRTTAQAWTAPQSWATIWAFGTSSASSTV